MQPRCCKYYFVSLQPFIFIYENRLIAQTRAAPHTDGVFFTSPVGPFTKPQPINELKRQLPKLNFIPHCFFFTFESLSLFCCL